MLSIVIPTKDEEDQLPRLLQSIKEQDFDEKYEIIVADAYSTDNTRKIAKKYGCRIISRGGHASRGRNLGAKAAKGQVILFLDADTALPKSFIRINYSEFLRKKLDVASCLFTPRSKSFIDIAMHEIANLHYSITKKIKPIVPGMFFIISKKNYFKFGGYDESITWFDDVAFSNSLPKNVKYDILPIRLNISVRRINKVGRFRFSWIMILLVIYRFLGKNYQGSY